MKCDMKLIWCMGTVFVSVGGDACLQSTIYRVQLEVQRSGVNGPPKALLCVCVCVCVLFEYCRHFFTSYYYH